MLVNTLLQGEVRAMVGEREWVIEREGYRVR